MGQTYVAKKLKEIRAGRSYREVAAESGVSATCWWYAESKGKTLSPKTAAKIRERYNLTPTFRSRKAPAQEPEYKQLTISDALGAPEAQAGTAGIELLKILLGQAELNVAYLKAKIKEVEECT